MTRPGNVRAVLTLLLLACTTTFAQPAPPRDPLAPRGLIHIPIGIANTNDRLKTFVEPEGNFSPGVGSYGVYFWATDPATGKLVAPTMDGVKVEHGLAPGGLLIPWSRWNAGTVEVRTEVCQTVQQSPAGPVHVVAARARVTNTSAAPADTTVYVALRSTGPAGFSVNEVAERFGEINGRLEGIDVDGRPAIVLPRPLVAKAVGSTTDFDLAAFPPPQIGPDNAVRSPDGRGAAAIPFPLRLAPGASETIEILCPVLPGRRVLPHQWDGVSKWAQFDLAPFNPATGGDLQPNPDVDFYRSLKVHELFAQAQRYYKDLAARAKVALPDPRWTDALTALASHAALAMNDGAPDVAVLNYNVYNRDGVYVASMLHKAGRPDLAEKCIDYFLKRPFNGRVHPEADNPGQILWIMGEHWAFTKDKAWLARVAPSVRKLAAMIRYYRTTPEPHWVGMTSLDFGDAVPADQRKQLKPGSCDGHHPEYTEAFDVAGLNAAAELIGQLEGSAANEESGAWGELAEKLRADYGLKYRNGYTKAYGSYCVFWPCRLFGLTPPPDLADPQNHPTVIALKQFKAIGPQPVKSWRYFSLARAHQALLAGSRETAHKTIAGHLDHPHVTGGQTYKAGEPARGFFAFDEGGKSGAAGWRDKDGKALLSTTWNGDVAMPHGWSIAELHLLIRDALAYEDNGRLVLLAGIPPEWFDKPMKIENLPTHFGPLSLSYLPPTTPGGEPTIKVTGVSAPGGVTVVTSRKRVDVTVTK